ncbi:peptidyl-prolyl cis-trans isomerase FKBP17-1, chloroplastic isoform X2 [Alnus glutinosa]|uniref:peptidyl-prolyl cis-trans isomerase FKBP17-1, chloroplastic isoform X2 n=1 Tax=Alnus glutinosa TaxID=3517 RepID=UPI002D76FFC3|nr:peptidyl-prolyl cis-trans isomerase FKBP17-1, chloroplastic isoform X2 [Alnus glutinosa]
MIQCAAAVQCPRASHHSILRFVPPISPSNNVSATSSPASSSSVTSRRAALSLSLFSATFSALIFSPPASSSSSKSAISEFRELPNSGGVKVLDVRFGSGELPLDGDQVISGIEAAVRSMKVGGIRRVIIPQSQGYQSTSQEPIPPNFFDRQRLFTTIFNPTRLANGEGSTLGTLIFDIEFVSARHQ